MQRTALFVSTAIVAMLIVVGPVRPVAAEYPERAVTMINPQSPGGAHDSVGRAFAAVAERYLGKPLVVVNKPGASTMIGTIAVAQAPPDGYTLLLASSITTTVVEWEILHGRKPGATRADFVSIGSLIQMPTVLSVPADSPWKSIADLVRDAKAKPGFYAFGSSGLLTPTHLGSELFARAYGLSFRHVPFAGGGPVLTAVVGKHVDFTTQFTVTTIPLAQGNKLRILAVQGDRRLKAIPNVPTFKELGVNLENYMWIGLVAPKNTPLPIVEKLQDVTAKVAKDKAFIDAIEKLGDEVRFMSGPELSQYWDKESEENIKILRQLQTEGIRLGE
jgi:tripartite-type tricarboxylate transporter receptor subunit TctC